MIRYAVIILLLAASVGGQKKRVVKPKPKPINVTAPKPPCPFLTETRNKFDSLFPYFIWVDADTGTRLRVSVGERGYFYEIIIGQYYSFSDRFITGRGRVDCRDKTYRIEHWDGKDVEGQWESPKEIYGQLMVETVCNTVEK